MTHSLPEFPPRLFLWFGVNVSTSPSSEVGRIRSVGRIQDEFIFVAFVHDPFVVRQLFDRDILAEETLHNVESLINLGDMTALGNRIVLVANVTYLDRKRIGIIFL